MTLRQEVKEKYFNWLYDRVCKGRSHDKVSYKKLFEFLHQVEFIFVIPNDLNRAKDGINLRYRFAVREGDERLADIIDDGPCSVLEMMVALAVRCEETIMDDSRYGDRTGQWFWGMIHSLGIGHMTDDIFNAEVLNEIIYDFLYRCYEPDGRGGLFYIRNCESDLREVEIWTQLLWYLNDFA